MRILDIKEKAVSISRYRDPSIPSGDLTTSIIAIVTDAVRDGEPVIGYGFSSMGRYAQSGLIRERFARRLVAAPGSEICGDSGNLDPFKCWRVMMAGEKPGGHGERCVAVGTLDMALWDAAAKVAQLPLASYLAQRCGRTPAQRVAVYAGGGYYYPDNDVQRLREEIAAFRAMGYADVKIKIGARPLNEDLRRIGAAQEEICGSIHLAVDAMNAYGRADAMEAATALRNYALRWFEDICDPLDFETLADVKKEYALPVAAGEALFSLAEANLLARYGGLNRREDILLFDPVHTYGLPEYLRILEYFEGAGWPRSAFWPHGGHLFSLHVAAALGLGGAEVNPLAFPPFGGLSDDAVVNNGFASMPPVPGIGFETKRDLHAVLRDLTADVIVTR